MLAKTLTLGGTGGSLDAQNGQMCNNRVGNKLFFPRRETPWRDTLDSVSVAMR